MTFEFLPDGAWETLRRILGLIASSLIDTGGRSIGIRFGSGTVTFPGGAQTSTVMNVSHGLGKTPVCVLLTSQSATVMFEAVAPLSATQIGVEAATRDLSSPVLGTTRSFYWVVIG